MPYYDILMLFSACLDKFLA